MTSISRFLYKSELKKVEDGEIASNDEERDYNPIQALVAQFEISNYQISSKFKS